MVTVSAGRSCSSTFRAARRVTVPSGSSSPEQATIPTFFLGRSGMLASLFPAHDSIHHNGYFPGQDMRQLLTGLVKFSNAQGLEILMTAVHIQYCEFLRDRPAALPDHFGSAGQLAAINGHRRALRHS